MNNISSINETVSSVSANSASSLPFDGLGPPPDLGSFTISSLQRNLILYGYLTVFLFGFFGHSISIAIFRRQTLRKVSTSILFIYMTISNGIYLFSCFYNFLFLGLNIPTTNRNMMNQLCRVYSFIQYFCMCCTVWLLLTITIDRWIRIRFPCRVKQLCTRKRVSFGTCLLSIISSIEAVGDTTACFIDPIYLYFYSNVCFLKLKDLANFNNKSSSRIYYEHVY